MRRGLLCCVKPLLNSLLIFQSGLSGPMESSNSGNQPKACLNLDPLQLQISWEAGPLFFDLTLNHISGPFHFIRSAQTLASLSYHAPGIALHLSRFTWVPETIHMTFPQWASSSPRCHKESRAADPSATNGLEKSALDQSLQKDAVRYSSMRHNLIKAATLY